MTGNSYLHLLWMIVLFLVPLAFILQSFTRLYRSEKKLNAADDAAKAEIPPQEELKETSPATPQKTEVPLEEASFTVKKRWFDSSQKYFLIVPVVIFLIFIVFRIFSPEYIYLPGRQGNIFYSIWIYVLLAGIPAALYGLVRGLRALNRNEGKGWPVLLIFISLASLFIISVFAVLLLM